MTRPSDPLWTAICKAVEGCSDVVNYHQHEIRTVLDAYQRAAASQRDSLREARVMAAFDGWTAESGVTLREAIRAALAKEPTDE